MFRVLTVAREYGSGGGRIARSIAKSLGWSMLDKELVDAIARSAQVDPELVRRYDERVDSWLHRVSSRGLWHGAFGRTARATDAQFFDAETMAAFARILITDAHAKGNCVILGRGAQCVLQGRRDVLHVFVYASLPERIVRVRNRVQAAGEIEQLVRSTDQERADYIRKYFECNWDDRSLYDVLISSELGEENVARTLIDIIQRGRCARL